MNLKTFYDSHRNFALRTIIEYYISPGIRCKYDILCKRLKNVNQINNAIDLGCSGNSILFFLNKIKHKSLLDLADSPLKQYRNLKERKRENRTENPIKQVYHPINGDICHLPYREKCFDLVSALDVLEHLKEDKLAIDEISRILKKDGYLILTVPHQMKYFDEQDKIIGHYRRYEIEPLEKVFSETNFHIVEIFGVYGQLFKFSKLQKYDPKTVEEGIISLRIRYQKHRLFRTVWNLIVSFIAFIMRIDARIFPLRRALNIGLIVQKIR